MDRPTIDTYDEKAEAFAARFSSERILEGYLDTLFQLVQKPDPDVLDVGCGNAKYAKAVTARGGTYTGLDASARLLELAQCEHEEQTFICGDMVQHEYPVNQFDIILSVTAIVHIDKAELATMLEKFNDTLRSDGVVFLSCKEDEYHTELVESAEGKRRFYYYQLPDIEEVLPEGLKIVESEVEDAGTNRFLNLILQKT